jgi:hypothetical protein
MGLSIPTKFGKIPINLFFELVDLLTYLIRKVGQGHNFLLSPMLMSYGAIWGI